MDLTFVSSVNVLPLNLTAKATATTQNHLRIQMVAIIFHTGNFIEGADESKARIREAGANQLIN